MQISVRHLLASVSPFLLLPKSMLSTLLVVSFYFQSQTELTASQRMPQEPTEGPSRLSYLGIGYIASDLRQPFTLPAHTTPEPTVSESVSQPCSPSDSKQVKGQGQGAGLLLRGVLGTAQHRIALLQTLDGKSLQVREGDRLDAQGSMVARVMSNRVEIAQVSRDQHGCIQTRKLTLTLEQR